MFECTISYETKSVMSNHSARNRPHETTNAPDIRSNKAGDASATLASPSYQEDGYEDRRRHARANYRLKARYMGEGGNEYPCVVVNISAGGAMVRTKVAPKENEKVVLYVDSVGRFEGTVIRAGKRAFAVQYQSRRSKTQRTADALIRVLNRGQRGTDRRVTPRIDLNRTVKVTHNDGTHIECAIMDISLTGASLNIDPAPPLGTEMIVGRMKARVVRRHDVGVGVIFLGSTENMDDVISQASGDDTTKSGTEIASSFGRKHAKK